MTRLKSTITQDASKQPTLSQGRLAENQSWLARQIMGAYSSRLADYAATGAFASNKEIQTLVEKAISNNRKSVHMVCQTLENAAKADDNGKELRFILEFYSYAQNSTTFISRIFDHEPKYTISDIENVLKTIYIRNRLTPENELWTPIKCDEEKFNGMVGWIQPVFEKLAADGKGFFTLDEGLEILGHLGTWEQCSLPNEIFQNEVANAKLMSGFAKLHSARRLTRLLELGLGNWGFNIELYTHGEMKDDGWLLGAFKLTRVANAPHPVFIEKGSGQVFHNDSIKKVGGYFNGLFRRSYVFDDILGKHDLIGKYELPAEIRTVPHEMEHSIQSILGMSEGFRKWNEFGADLAALLSMGESKANLLLHSWDDRIRRNKFLGAITPLAKWALSINAIGETPAMILEEIGKVQKLHPRMPNMKIVRKLLDKFYFDGPGIDFYFDGLRITYTALENAAEGMFGKKAGA